MWQELQDDIRNQYLFFDHKAAEWMATLPDRGVRVSCGRGCRTCCNLTVNATFTEALGIAGAMTARHLPTLKETVFRLLDIVRDAPDFKSYLRNYRKKVVFCPFLEGDGSCGVYPTRPFSCRSLLSTRNADYCGVDFGDLHPLEKQAFLSSLDPSVVAFPTHYLAAPREIGRDLEILAARKMTARFGFSLSGNLPFLLYLEQEFRLSGVMAEGREATVGLLKKEGLDHPFLVTLEQRA
jgi:Fe-S-cluster containining protein